MTKRPSTLRGRIPRPTRLGEMLRLYRTVNSRTLREVAVQIGLSHGTLWRIETGQEMEATALLRLWQWLFTEESR